MTAGRSSSQIEVRWLTRPTLREANTPVTTGWYPIDRVPDQPPIRIRQVDALARLKKIPYSPESLAWQKPQLLQGFSGSRVAAR